MEDLTIRLAAAKDACDEREGQLDDLHNEMAAAQDRIAELLAEVDGHEANAAEQVQIPHCAFLSQRADGEQ